MPTTIDASVSNAGLWAPEALEARLRDTRVRNLLRINAGFSAATGLVAALAPGRVARMLGIDSSGVVRVVGVALLAYAMDLLVAAALRRNRLVPLARVVAGADAAWVLGTVVVAMTGAVSSEGALLLGGLAVPVGALAVGQWQAAAAATRDGLDDERPPIEAIRVEVVSGEGKGMVRRCVARGGKDWTETCTLWDPGRRHAVEVDPAAYPFPLATVGCLSYVEPQGDGQHRIGALFQLQARAGLGGQVMMLVMHLGRPILRRIVRGWDRAARHRAGAMVFATRPDPPTARART